MNKLLDAFNGGTVEQQTRRKKGMLLIAATSALLILATLILIIGTIVALITGNTSGSDEFSQDDTRYVKGSFEADDLYEGNLLLLDANHPYRGETPNTILFSNNRPVNSEGNYFYFTLDVNTFSATKETVNHFADMMEAFYDATENDCVFVMQAYQKGQPVGSQVDEIYEGATTIQLGYFVESGVYNSIYDEKDYKWIYDHAHEYGFVQVSKAEGEEDIFRYVGVPHATYMKANNLTLFRYLEKLHETSYKKSLKITAGGEDYRVYYVAADDDVYVPDHGNYDLSGDNMGGYIVTVYTEELY